MIKKTGVVAFAFGVPSSLPSNIALGGMASMSASRKKIPYYTQEDVPERGPCPRTVHAQEPGRPPSTLVLAQGIMSWAAELGLERLFVVAAPPHISRVLRDLTETARERNIAIEFMTASPKPHEDCFWFSENSTQLRARSRLVWYVREFIVMRMPWWLYKIIAT